MTRLGTQKKMSIPGCFQNTGLQQQLRDYAPVLSKLCKVLKNVYWRWWKWLLTPSSEISIGLQHDFSCVDQINSLGIMVEYFLGSRNNQQSGMDQDVTAKIVVKSLSLNWHSKQCMSAVLRVSSFSSFTPAIRRPVDEQRNSSIRLVHSKCDRFPFL